MKDLSSLRIYSLAVSIGEDVWNLVYKWNSFAKWSLGKQMVDSADGIAATMIEGYYRYSKGDQAKFFQYSLALAKETELWLWRAKQRNLIDADIYVKIIYH